MVSTENVTEDQILNYLARIIWNIYLAEQVKQQEQEENSTPLKVGE